MTQVLVYLMTLHCFLSLSPSLPVALPASSASPLEFGCHCCQIPILLISAVPWLRGLEVGGRACYSSLSGHTNMLKLHMEWVDLFLKRKLRAVSWIMSQKLLELAFKALFQLSCSQFFLGFLTISPVLHLCPSQTCPFSVPLALYIPPPPSLLKVHHHYQILRGPDIPLPVFFPVRSPKFTLCPTSFWYLRRWL